MIRNPQRTLLLALLVADVAVAFTSVAQSRFFTVKTSSVTCLQSAPPQQRESEKNLQNAIESMLQTQSELMDSTSPPLSVPEDDESEQAFINRHVARDALSALMDPQDEALRLVSSEMGIKQLIGEPIDDAAVATAILMERTLDTLEDVGVHLRRKWIENLRRDKETTKNDNRKTVVVLGSGWGAHALMKVVDTQKVRLIVVSPTVRLHM